MIGRNSKYENQQTSAAWRKKRGRFGGWGAERNEVKTLNFCLYFTKGHLCCLYKPKKKQTHGKKSMKKCS